jgi:hypothetical protein
MYDATSTGFIGFGVGIIAACFLSIPVLIRLHIFNSDTFKVVRCRYFFIFKFISAFVLIIVGAVYRARDNYYDTILGAGILGSGIGVLISSILSTTMAGLIAGALFGAK